MGTAVGSKDRASAAPNVANRNKRVIVDSSEHASVGARCGSVVTQELWPARETLENRMLGLDDRWGYALWTLAAVVCGQQLDRQHVLNGAPFIVSLRLDSLEREITANHQQPPSAKDKVMDKLQSIRRGFRPDEHAIREKQRVRANVAENDDVEVLELFTGAREELHSDMTRLQVGPQDR